MGKWILVIALVVAVVGVGIYAAAQEAAVTEKAASRVEKPAGEAEGAAEKAAEKTEAKAEKAAEKAEAKVEKSEEAASAAAERPERSSMSVWRELMTMSAKKGTPVLILVSGEDLGLSEEQVKKIEAIADKSAKDAQALLTDEQKTKLAAIQEEMSRPRERGGR